MRGEPAQPKSAPVTDNTAAVKPVDDLELRRKHALDLAFQIENHNVQVKGAATISVEQLLKDAKAIELYLKGETE